MLKVKGAVQHYDWGRIGHDSDVAQLHCLSSGTEIEQSKPYAELWMGTHPSAPSFLFESDIDSAAENIKRKSSPEGMLLKEWLEEHPEALGDAVCKKWNGELPFLFKVLSVAKALSIQAHPDKQLAEQLHLEQPKIYKDPNHKPEMALALTDFEALCGFVTSQELKRTLQDVPELRRLLEKRDVEILLNVSKSELLPSSKPVLQRAFTTLMKGNKGEIAEAVRDLKNRLTTEEQSRELTLREKLLLTLETQYPDDVGVLASLFLNYIQLKPGEAVYLAANVPHAYLSGACVECMATSDNVVRAGLTPKFRDTATLSSMLTYEQGLPHVLSGTQISAYTKRYSPPFDEFEVDMITIPGGHSLEFSPIEGPSMFIVSDGAGILAFDGERDNQVAKVQKGDIFFLPAGKGVHISPQAGKADRIGHANGNGHVADSNGLANGVSCGKGHLSSNGNGHLSSNGNGHLSSNGNGHLSGNDDEDVSSNGNGHLSGNGNGHFPSNGNGHFSCNGNGHLSSNGNGRGSQNGHANGYASGDTNVFTYSDGGIPIRLYRAGVNSTGL